MTVHDTISNNIYTDTGDITISGSTFMGTSTGDYPTLYAMDNVFISEGSNVTANADESNGVFAYDGEIKVSDSTFTGKTKYPALYSDYSDITISGSRITAGATDDFAIWAYKNLDINENTILDITGANGISGNTITLEDVAGKILAKDGDDSSSIYSHGDDISFTNCNKLTLNGDLAVNAENDVTIQNSELKITGVEPLYAWNNLSVIDSKVTVDAQDRPIMAKAGTLLFEGKDTEVKATGAWFINGKRINIEDGTIDVNISADPDESVMAAVFADQGVSVSGGKLTAKITGGENTTTRAMMSNGKIEFTGGTITLDGGKAVYVSKDGGELSFGGQNWYQWTNTELGKPVSSVVTPYVYNQEDSYVRIEPLDAVYTLTVENGEGSGSYMAGEKVEISAETYNTDGHFAGWSVTGYKGTILASADEATTTVTIPPTDFTVTANYEDHTLSHVEAKDPTCTEVGWKAYDYCTGCEYSTYEELEMLEHTPDGTGWHFDANSHWNICECGVKINEAAHSGGEATCTAQAVCQVCGQSYGEKDKNHHTGDLVWVQTPDAHKQVYSCCSADAGEKEAHIWADGKCTVCNYPCVHSGGKATCSQYAVCELCGSLYGELDPDHHTNLVKTEETPATHMEEGNTAYWYCDGCKKYFSDEAGTEEIASEDTVVPKLPEHAADGTGWHFDANSHWNTCECGEEFNKAAHSFVWVTDQEATDTEPGAKHEECEVCGYAKDPVEIPATGDQDDPPVIERPETDPPAGGEKPEQEVPAGTGAPSGVKDHPDAPPAKSPATGDDGNPLIWLVGVLAMGTVLAGAGIYRRKNR